MAKWSWEELAGYRSRVRGCLLGGALGDALGYPVERQSLREIRAQYGPTGITGLVKDPDTGRTGLISDDTQMTLFSAEGWLAAYRRAVAKGIGGAETAMVHDAYQRWLETQDLDGPPPADGLRHRVGMLRGETWLYARRGPGLACLSGLRERYEPLPWLALDGTPGQVNPGSKGCGTVMRSAPFGFTGGQPKPSFELAARCAQITHGHPTGYLAAGAFAAMVSLLVVGESLDAAVRQSAELLAQYPGHQQTSAALARAVALAADGGPATPELVESLGGGWIAEEALSIAVYCALATTEHWKHRTPVESALLLSVNHSGDSDSTGSVCGNLLGARHGDVLLPQEWLARVEGRAVIATLGDDFAAAAHPGEARPWEY